MPFQKIGASIPDCSRLALAVDVGEAKREYDALCANPPESRDSASYRSHYLIGHLKGGTPHEEREALRRSPAIRQIIHELLPGRALRALLNYLEPGGMVSPHRDGMAQFVVINKTLRIHVPFQTNERAHIIVGGKAFHMATGEVWMLNGFLEHSAVNEHEDRGRIHLIVDLEPDEQLLTLVEASDCRQGVDAKPMQIRMSAQQASSRQTPGGLGRIRVGAKTTVSLARRGLHAASIAPFVPPSVQLFQELQGWCLLLGHSGCGANLVGEMLNTHMQACIATNLSYRPPRSKWEVTKLCASTIASRWRPRFGRPRGTLRILGHLGGPDFLRRIWRDPGELNRLRDGLQRPVKFVHVVRNPVDAIGQIARQTGEPLEACLDAFFVSMNTLHLISVLHPVLTICHEEMVSDPHRVAEELSQWLGLECSDEWLDRCSEVVRSVPLGRQTHPDWTRTMLDRVARQIDEHPFLARYASGSESAEHSIVKTHERP